MASPLGLIAPSLAARRTRPAGEVTTLATPRSFVISAVPMGWTPQVAVGPNGAGYGITSRVLSRRTSDRSWSVSTTAALVDPPRAVRFETASGQVYDQFVPPSTPQTPTPVARWSGPGTDLRNGLLVSGAPADAVFVASDEVSAAPVTRDARGAFVPHAPSAYTVRAKAGTTVAASQINSARYGEIPVTWDAMVNFASRIRVVGAAAGDVRINGADVSAAGFTDSRGAFVVASVPGSQGVTVGGRTVTVAPQSGQTVTVTFPEGAVVTGDVDPAPVLGTIEIYGLLPSDGITLDGVTATPTPEGAVSRLARVTAGTHALRVTRAGVQPFTQMVSVTPPTVSTVYLSFDALPPPASDALGWLALLAGVGGVMWWASKQ